MNAYKIFLVVRTLENCFSSVLWASLMMAAIGFGKKVALAALGLSTGAGAGLSVASSAARVARFFLTQYTKTGETIPNCH
jgi:hypothetical protein